MGWLRGSNKPRSSSFLPSCFAVICHGVRTARTEEGERHQVNIQVKLRSGDFSKLLSVSA
jgi:hypothetical protein